MLVKKSQTYFGGYLVQIVFIEETNSSRMLFNVQLYKDNLLFWKMILMTLGAFNTIALLIKKKKRKEWMVQYLKNCYIFINQS